MNHFAIIVSGGKGLRMGAGVKKQYLSLAGIPMLARTLQAIDRCAIADDIILVVPKEDLSYCRENIIPSCSVNAEIHLVPGGEKRQDSVYNGLKKIKNDLAVHPQSLVMIHDGVRPFVSRKIVTECSRIAAEKRACIPCVQIVDTVKRAAKDGSIQETVSREGLFAAQTPQIFQFDLIWKAFLHAAEKGFIATDDASLVEFMGEPVFSVQGSSKNIKLTTPQDLILAEHFLK